MTVAESVPATPVLVGAVASRMRAADRAEVAAQGLTPAQAIVASMYGSDFSRALLIEGEPAAVFGVRSLGGRIGEPWVLTADAVARHPFTFWKASLHVVKKLKTRYRVLTNCIDARYAQSIAWARRLGFTVEEPHACGPLGMPFHRVVLYSAGKE